MKHQDISLHTKKELAKALKNAMQKKPFQKITVSELIQECDVNRKTFYYHFQDIYDLLKWLLEEEAIEIIKHFDLLEDHAEAITFIMDYVEENAHILNCAYDSIGRDQLKRFFYMDFHEIIISIIESAEKRANISLDPSYKEFLTSFYMEGISGILIDWMKEHDKRDRFVTMEYISKIMKDSLYGIFTADSRE